MNEKEILKKLMAGISKLELPPVSEEVLKAVREQKQASLADTETSNTPSEKRARIIRIKIFAAAMLLALTVSTPVIIIVSQKAPVAEVSEESSKSSVYEPVSITESSIESTVESQESDKEASISEPVSENALENIIEERLYGEVALSGRSQEELKMLFENYSDDDLAYEDENYLYHFDTGGRLSEICIKPEAVIEGKKVSEKYIKDLSDKLLRMYCPEIKLSEQTIDITHNDDSYPAWCVLLTCKENELLTRRTIMTFDGSGILLRLGKDGTADNIGSITKEQAAKAALKVVRSDKYDIPEFKNEDIEIIVNEGSFNNKKCYTVFISNVPIGRNMFTVFFFKIDPDDGSVLYVEKAV